MAFDAGMVSFVTREINNRVKDGKVEKIYQPQKDEIILSIRCGGENHRLLINVGSSNARLNLTSMKPDNPANPPMFCMMLRKHFQGAKIIGAEQLGFERAVRITFDTYDDLGFLSHKHMIVEIMGTYSNLIITDKEDKILGAAKIIDISTSHKRQVLPGMKYEMPPAQNKLNPLEVTSRQFLEAAAEADSDMSCEKFIISSFSGIAPVIAREIVYRAAGNTAATVRECEANLENEFFGIIQKIKDGEGIPTLVSNGDAPLEYAFAELRQFSGAARISALASFGELIDKFFFTRAYNERIKHRASDVSRILSNAEKRITKKIDILSSELASSDEGEKYKLYGDLITANIYRMKKGESKVEVENFYDEMKPVTISLDTRMTPAGNAQKYYKKYNKTKSAKTHLTEQLEIARREYEYIMTVFDSLSRASSEKEIAEIRSELYHSGYASKMRGYYGEKKKQTPSFEKYKTSGGYTVLCGKNNLANDYITFKLGEKEDWWFHVKNQPGSHVLMQCPKDEEPSELDFTEAAMIAACNSKAAAGAAVDVDYTKARYVKKPPAAKPGYVIYHTNYSARVMPDSEIVTKLLTK